MKTTNTCNDCDVIEQITIRVDVSDIFNGMTIITDISITMSISVSSSDSLTNRFDRINSNLGKGSKPKCEYVNNMDTTVILNKIRAATLILGLFLTTTYFTMKVTHGLSINVIVWIEFDVIIVLVIQIISILPVQSSIGAVDCNTQMICNVCGVFYYIFIFCLCSILSLQ